jgi:hypothetical protein
LAFVTLGFDCKLKDLWPVSLNNNNNNNNNTKARVMEKRCGRK